MAEPFNVNQYWLKRGRTYIQEDLPKAYHRLQETFLTDVLRAGHVPLRKILELGCGFGRITKILAEAFPRSQIVALDLSPDQLANASRYCGPAENITFEQYDLYSGLPFPGFGYEASIAIEVLLHHPPAVVGGLLQKLSEVSQHIVNIDWSEPWPWKTPEHVWVHDYQALYAAANLKCACFPLPQKVDGMQQKLFIAGRELPPELLELEKQTKTEQASIAATGAASNQVPPSSARWAQDVQLAIDEILQLVPAGNALILINEDQWGNAESALADRRVIPFLERDGRYWGPPSDDEQAIRELERLREAGARFAVVAWNSFWWLEHYRNFGGYLRQRYPCIRADNRLVVFDLKPYAEQPP